MSDASASTRLPGLDWVRLLGLCAVVALHGAVTYMSHPPDGLYWPLYEKQTTASFDAVFLACRSWSLGAFFALAGFLASESLARRTPGDFLKDRLLRLGIPLLLGILIVLPLMHIPWALGLHMRDKAPLEAIWKFRIHPEFQSRRWGVAHLWFLRDLLVFTILHAAIAHIRARFRSPRAVASSPDYSGRNLSVFVLARCMSLAGLAAAAVWWWPWVLTDFRNSFAPHAQVLAYSVPAYVAGAWLARASITAGPATSAIALVLGLLGIFSILSVMQGAPLWTDWLLGREHIVRSIGAGLSGVCIPIGLIGLFGRVRQAPGFVTQIANRSFGIYVLHLFFMGWAILGFYRVGLPVWVEWAIVCLVAIVIPFVLVAIGDRLLPVLLGRLGKRGDASPRDTLSA